MIVDVCLSQVPVFTGSHLSLHIKRAICRGFAVMAVIEPSTPSICSTHNDKILLLTTTTTCYYNHANLGTAAWVRSAPSASKLSRFITVASFALDSFIFHVE
jgi:hypothetical protein